MRLDYLKEKKKLISIVLCGVSALLVVLTLIKVVAFLAVMTGTEDLIKSSMVQFKPDANEVQEYLAKSQAIADGLKMKNLFEPPAPKQHPVKQVSGILGNSERKVFGALESNVRPAKAKGERTMG